MTKRPVAIFAALLVLGGCLRLLSATDKRLEIIERNEFVPAALTISWNHLPIRVSQHGAVPIYLIRASTILFGPSVLGMRMVSVIAGTATILLLYLMAARWWGPAAGLIAAALLTIERYHVEISGRAIDLPFDLFFVALAMYAFSRFLSWLDRPDSAAGARKWLYVTGASCGVGFLCKELTGIMLPVLLLTFVFVRRTDWLRRRDTWLAAGVFVLLIVPDLYASLATTPAERASLSALHQQSAHHLSDALNMPEIRGEAEEYPNGLFMSYGDQLSRFRSIGFNAEPFYFYFGGILDGLGVPHVNEYDEFPYLHPATGVLLWVGVLVALVTRPKDKLTVFCLTMFFVAFIPFAMVQLGDARGDLPTDPVMLWYWVDRTMLPAMLLTAHGASVLLKRVSTARVPLA